MEHSRTIEEKNNDALQYRALKNSLKRNLAVSIRSRLAGFYRADLDIPSREHLPERLEEFGDMVMCPPHKFRVEADFGPDGASTEKDTDKDQQ